MRRRRPIATFSATQARTPTELTYVALARIYEFANDNEYAVKLYDKAIEIGDVPSGGFRDAIAAKQRLLKPQP